MTRVACIGECMMELSERPDGSIARGFGGDTLNTAVYLARLGVEVDYVTALGDDPFSDEMIAKWHAEGIGTELVLRCPGAMPGLYMIQTDASGERRFFYWRDSAPARRLLALPEMSRVEATLLQHDLIYLSGITLSVFDAAGRERLFGILDHMRARGGRVAFDTNFRPRGWPDRQAALHAYGEILRRADTVLVSTEDHGLLWGEMDMDRILSHLRAHGMKELVLKLAEPGCIIAAHDSETVHVPALPSAVVVDTTAAGDSFAAAFLAARAAGLGVKQAAEAGHRLARAVIAHRGAIIPLDAMPEQVIAAIHHRAS
jgi:2-dehydro-3-deoxygluconokinase